MNIRRMGFVAATIALALAVAACGGSDTVGGEETQDGSEDPTTEPDGGMEFSDADFVLVTGETDEMSLGYALKGEEITSPGPKLRLRKDEEVTIALENTHSDVELHDFVVVAEKQAEAEPLWGAVIRSSEAGAGEEAPLRPGERGAVTFTPDASGKFFYICSVPGHMSVGGMWGRLVVEE